MNLQYTYEAAMTLEGGQTHAMTRVAAARARKYSLTYHASAVCGSMAQPIDSEFDPNSAYACGNCKRVIAAGVHP